MESQTKEPNSGKNFRVSFVVVNWNREDLLEKCLDSILALDYPIHEIVVSDNGSTDGSTELMRTKYTGKVTAIENGQNYGAPVGRNIGIRQALKSDIDFIFCLDNDLTIAPDAIAKLVAVLQRDEKIAMAGALIMDMAQPDVISSAGGLVNWTQNMVKTLGMNQRLKGQFRDIWDVDYAGSGALFVRTDYLRQHGLFDEGFIGYGYEDTDFGMRAKKLGYRVVCCADAKVWHRPHSSIGRYSFKKKYLETRNAIRFIKRYGDTKAWIKYLFYVNAGFVYAFFSEGIKGNLPGVIGKVRGFIDGLRNRDDLALKLLGRQAEK
jgi:GT2 family glycosyltransferase